MDVLTMIQFKNWAIQNEWLLLNESRLTTDDKSTMTKLFYLTPQGENRAFIFVGCHFSPKDNGIW
jgi:hypothetical protein